MIRLLLVDDHDAFRQPMAFMLSQESGFSVVGQADSLAEARRHLNGVDVALVDLDLPDGDGVDLIRDLRAANPHGSALVLTASGSRADQARAVEGGVSGVLHKSSPVVEIIDAVRRVSVGEPLFEPGEVIELLRSAARRREEDWGAKAALSRLTQRERQVLEALGEGLSDKQIGDCLNVSTETVRTHMVNILAKLGVDSRLQALVFAVRHGAITIT